MATVSTRYGTTGGLDFTVGERSHSANLNRRRRPEALRAAMDLVFFRRTGLEEINFGG